MQSGTSVIAQFKTSLGGWLARNLLNAGDPAERVRKAATNQIRRALERICAAHPELGRHLTNALRTGFVCAYRPEHPVAWRIRTPTDDHPAVAPVHGL